LSESKFPITRMEGQVESQPEPARSDRIGVAEGLSRSAKLSSDGMAELVAAGGPKPP
jgi:predicted FMN-binding regulatory protein PaiB